MPLAFKFKVIARNKAEEPKAFGGDGQPPVASQTAHTINSRTGNQPLFASNAQQWRVINTDDHAHVVAPSFHATSAPVPLRTRSSDQRRRPPVPHRCTGVQRRLTGTHQAAATAAEP
eukprot:scaffold4440_cov38-Cyclotella_meneghiniana.AAC.1